MTDRYLKIAVKSPESRYSSSEYDLGALKACRYSRIVVIQIVVISEVECVQLDGTLLWAWKFGRYSQIVVISAVVIGEVDCMNEYSDLFRVRLFLKKPSEYSSTRFNCFTPINNTGLELALDINTLVVNTVIIARKIFSHCMLTPDAALHAIFHVHVCETQLHSQGRRCM